MKQESREELELQRQGDSLLGMNAEWLEKYGSYWSLSSNET